MTAIILGFISGIIFGLTGSGGGILATPFLMYGLGLPIHHAISITLLTLSFTGIVGSVKLFKIITPLWQEVAIIALTGTIASLIGSLLNPLMPARELALVFAVVLLAIGYTVWTNSAAQHAPVTDNAVRKRYGVLCLVGIGAGFLNGFLGISGGVIIVSSLIILMRYPMREAAAISIMIVTIISIISTISHFFFSWRTIHWDITIAFVFSSCVGMFIAAHFAHLLPEKYIKKGLAVIILALGISMLTTDLISDESGIRALYEHLDRNW